MLFLSLRRSFLRFLLRTDFKRVSTVRNLSFTSYALIESAFGYTFIRRYNRVFFFSKNGELVDLFVWSNVFHDFCGKVHESRLISIQPSNSSKACRFLRSNFKEKRSIRLLVKESFLFCSTTWTESFRSKQSIPQQKWSPQLRWRRVPQGTLLLLFPA